MMSLIVPLIPLASKPRPACLAATAAAHKLPDGRRAQTAHFQLFYYECKVPTNVTDVCPISNSPTTSATKLRMCVGSGGLSVPRVWAEAAAVAVGGGRRAGMPAAPPNGGAGVRRLQQAVGIGVTAAAAAVRDRCACGRSVQPAAALRAWWGGGRAEASGGGASGGRGARRSDPATMMCAGSAAAKVPAAMMWRELLSGGVPDSNQAGGGARRVRTKHTPWWLGAARGGGRRRRGYRVGCVLRECSEPGAPSP